mgnify:CR=1 FL=1
MAARIDRRHSELVRQRIQTSVIVERLHRHVMGELELSPTQISAANTLLDRAVPKLAQVQHVGDEDGGPVRHAVSVTYADPTASET